MTALPWDRFQPDEPPVPPPVPPPLVPAAQPPAQPPDAWGGQPPAPRPLPPAAPAVPDLGGSLSTALEAVWPALKAQALNYARESIAAAGRDEDVDHTHPTVTATTSTGKELVVADAKSRSWRTFLQGLAIDVTAALLAILTTLTGLDPFTRDTWIVIGALAVKTLVQTVISYIARLQITPTIKTEDGAKMALMPATRPMQASDKLTRRSDPDAAVAPLFGRKVA